MDGTKPQTDAEPTLQERVARLIRPEVRALRAYAVPEAGDRIKLDAMENPYAWPESLVDQWLEALRRVSLNRYPDPAARGLRERLREVLQVPAGAGLLLGNGSDELIQMIALAVAGSGRVVLAPEPTFVMYRLIAQVAGLRYEGVPLGADFSLDAEATIAAMARHDPAVVFLSYPNNPTGNLFDAAALEAVVARAPGLVVVDEAYTAFAEATCMEWLARFPHLLILRTVSKMGLAGLRLGMLAGAPAWLTEIDKTRLPYNVNVLTQASAAFALEHWALLQEQTARIRRDRAVLFRELEAMAEVTVFPSRANFLLFRVPAGCAGGIHAALRADGVLVKNLDGAGAALRDCLRVTVGTPEENRAFVDALRAALGAVGQAVRGGG